MAIYPAQVSFAGGELAASLWGREDLAKYAVGLRELTNFTVHPHGGVSNRAGMRFISEVKDSSQKVRLVAFESSENGCYILEFGNLYVRFYKDGHPILSGSAPYEIETPYATSDLPLLNFAQSADVFFIAHPKHVPYELSRYTDTSWTFEKFAFRNGPFRNINSSDITMAVSGTSGNVTLTASEAFFNSGHVWGLMGIYNDADEVSVRTQGGVTGVPVAVTFTKRTIEMYVIFGLVLHRVAFFALAADVESNVVRIGSTFNVSGVSYSITGMNSTANGYQLVTSPTLANVGTSNTIPIAEAVSTSILNIDSVWGAEVICYNSWSFETRGFWSGTVRIQRYSKSEDRWIDIYVLTSGKSAGSSKNFTNSGTVDEPTKFRIVSADFEQFLPSGNAEEDKGYCILTSNSTNYLGIARIVSVAADGLSASALVLRDFIHLNATKNWVEGAWSGYRGFPYAVGFYQDRLCFGGNYTEPQKCWMSVTGDYNNFENHIISQDDDAVTAALISRRVSPVRDIVPLSSLIVLTDSAEWTIDAGSTKSAITPSSLDAQVQGYRGCAAVPPVVIGDMLLFVQKQGKIIRDLGYVFESDSYSGNDLTVLATHLFRDSKIVSMDYQQDPDSIVWVVLADGTLLALTYLREHDVIAWSRIKTDGFVESVACISTGDRDETWLCVRRSVGGATKRFVEMIADRHVTAPEDGFFVDCGVSFDFAVASSSLTGLTHLNGRDVVCLADGNVVEGLTVANGCVTLPFVANNVHVGLPYTAALETLDLSISRRDGTQQGRKARLVSVTVRVENTRGLSVSAPQKDGSYSEVFEFKERTNEPYNAPIRLQTGLFDIGLASGFTSGRVRIEEKFPLPCTVLSLIPKVAVGE